MKGGRGLFMAYLAVSSCLLIHQAYFLVRSDFKWLFFDYSLLFMALVAFLSRIRLQVGIGSYIMFAAVILRLVLLFSEPNLSDDHYRFLWDGQMNLRGENVYAQTPSDQMKEYGNDESLKFLYRNMNSRDYFSVYPPIDQAVFSLSVLIAPSSFFWQLVSMKFILFLFDLITIILLPKLLQLIGQAQYYAALYLLNPLVIIETVGNLHFEGMTAAFLVLCFYLIVRGMKKASAVSLGLAASVKFIPFLFFPLFLRKSGLRNGMVIILISLLVLFIPFLPYFDAESFGHLGRSVNLYFGKFEFNAGIYYVIRSIGFAVKGYNIIGVAGWSLSALSGLIILFFALYFRPVDWPAFFTLALFSMLAYYLLATTIHPWYLVNLALLAGLSGRFLTVIPWTFLAFLSYRAYQGDVVREDTALLIMEYGVVLIAFFIEMKIALPGLRLKGKNTAGT